MRKRITESEEILHARALSRIVRAETWRRERIVNHFRFLLFSLIGLAEWVSRAGHGHPHLTAAPFIFLGWGVTVEIFTLTWLRKDFKPWMPAATTTIDIIALTVIMHIIYGHAVAFGEQSAREIERAMVGLLVLLSANIIRFSWRTSLWSGVCALAALGYLRVYSDTLGQTAVFTDVLVFAGFVALLIYGNRNFRAMTERLLFDLRRAREQRLASLRALVAGVAHEVNSPLGAISANAQLSSRAVEMIEQRAEGTDPETRHALASLKLHRETSLEAVDRISSIIRALRDFARLDESEVEKVDLRSMIDNCIELVSTEAGDHIRFAVQYPQPLEVMCRPADLNQVFMHVLTNAVQSIDGAGSIRVSGTREADMIRIEITDTGRGIEKKNLDGIFDLHLGRKGERVGVGLGLPISHSIVQDHGGTITVESSVNVGTTVTISLPVE
jgi:signal transduction histidine kinase